MKHSIIYLLTYFTIIINSNAQVFKNKEDNFKVMFFSETALENIDAVNTKAVSLINFKNDSVVVKITNTQFKFKSALMEEHFNENYIESEKYPYSYFKGKLSNSINYKKDGAYKIKVSGLFTIHGITRHREIEVTFNIANGRISVLSEFYIKLADHRIEIPSVVYQKVAESVKVTVNGDYIPLSGK